MRRMSEAIQHVWDKAASLEIRDQWGDLMSGQEILARAVPMAEWDALLYELKQGIMSPEAFISWGESYIDAYARRRIKARTERLLNSIQAKQNTIN